MSDKLIMNRPASCLGKPWREATPLGNGYTGALVYGGIYKENILFNRYDLWHGQKTCKLPDVSGVFAEMRAKMEGGDYASAQNMLCDALLDRGFDTDPGYPYPLGVLSLRTEPVATFKHYRRELDMKNGVCRISCREGENDVKRESFVHRELDVAVLKATSDEEKTYVLSFDVQDDGTDERFPFDYEITYRDGYIFFIADTASAVVYAEGTKAVGNSLEITSCELLLIVKCFSKKLSYKELCESVSDLPEYDELLSSHTKAHAAIYSKVTLELCSDGNTSNDALIDAAYDDEATPELIEKLWKFGRYLFIGGTREGGLPFALYGLWNAEYKPTWPQNVANENVQMIYWHALTGGFSALVLPLVEYYCRDLCDYREYAQKLFGKKGIYLSVYSTPVNRQPSPVVPVIIHYIGVAGWLSKHFYDYYKHTGDRETLEKYILPFITEAAEFYLDYISYDAEGRAEIYPSVSPENSPRNFIDDVHGVRMSHPMPAVKNSTMDIAIIKELLRNLLSLADEVEFDAEKVNEWRDALKALPDYETNEDGAVKEWQADGLLDNYFHRHLSHLYPLFPGDEQGIDKAAFERALELRVLQGQSGWSLMHMAGIYARLGRGEDAACCFDLLAKGCLLPNLMTLHNDYRDMGVTLELGQFAPIQLDALMGAVNVVQMMLLQSNEHKLGLFCALPRRLHSGKAENLEFFGGKASLEWADGQREARLCFERDVSVKLTLPEGKFLVNGTLYDPEKTYNFSKGEKVLVKSVK